MADFQDPKQLEAYLQSLGYEFNKHPSQQSPYVMDQLRATTFQGQSLAPSGAAAITARPQQPQSMVRDLTTGEEVPAPAGAFQEFGRPAGRGAVVDAAFTMLNQKQDPLAAAGAGQVASIGGGLQTVEAAGGPAPAAAAAGFPELDPGTLDLPALEDQPAAVAPGLVPEGLEVPGEPGRVGKFRAGRAIVEMSLGLGQMQSGARAVSPAEMAGGATTFLGGLMDSYVTEENRDTIWGRMGPTFAIIGTAINLHGQRESARIQRDYQVELQESIGEVLAGIGGL